MDSIQKNEQPIIEKKEKPYGKIIIVICLLLLLVSSFVSYSIIAHNNIVLNSWKTLYEVEHAKKIEQDKKIKENGLEIVDLKTKNENLKSDLTQYYEDLQAEKSITNQVFCKNKILGYDYSNTNFTYSGNTAINGELKRFVEKNLDSDERIIGATWNPIWNNVDDAMHKITITGNLIFYFITSFRNNDFPNTRNLIYWVDGGCFLDLPN